jgi:hypothetical protein
MVTARSVRIAVPLQDAPEKLPKASLGKDGLYIVTEGLCLCDYAQGPCALHMERERKTVAKPSAQITLWDLATFEKVDSSTAALSPCGS